MAISSCRADPRRHGLIQPLDHTIEWMWIQRSLLSGDCDGLEERLGPYIDFCQRHPSSELLTALGRSFLLLGKIDQAERYFSDLDGYRDECITVVSGLPRSGTSLMMQMLAVAGMPIVSDSTRSPDESNPLGYFEDTRVMGLANQSDWIGDAQGKAIKIVAPLLKYLPCIQRYRVIFMDRDLRSVVKSQRKMLDRSNRQGATMSDSPRREFERLFQDFPVLQLPNPFKA